MDAVSFYMFRWSVLLCTVSGFQLIKSETMYVSIGSNVTITCPSENVISWQYQDSKDVLAICEHGQSSINPNISNRFNVTSDCQLHIQNFTSDDLRIYFCTAAQQGKDKIRVKLRNIHIVGTNDSDVMQGIEGKNLTLTCNVTGFLPDNTLFWIKDNEVLASNRTSSLSYTLEARGYDNGKTFKCLSKNSKDTRQLFARVQLNLVLKPKVTITVTVMYSDKKTGNSFTVRQGQHVELQCQKKHNASGDVDIFSWLFNGHYFTTKTTQVVFNKINPISTGEYTCLGKNKAGVHSETISIIVTYFPLVKNMSRVFHTGEKPRILKCEVSGVPNVYKFTKWRHLVNEHHVRFLVGHENGTLTLPCNNTSDIQYDDSGLYICNVTNNIQNKNGQLWQFGTVNVIIKDMPVLAEPLKQVYVGRNIATTSVALYLLSSSELSILNVLPDFEGNWRVQTRYCAATTVHTIFHGTHVDVSGYVCNFSITKTKGEDITNYSVIISNECCNNMFNFSIISANRPEMPTHVQVLTLDENIIVKWKPGKSDGMLQTFFIQFRKRFEFEWSVIPADGETFVIIDGLQAETVYFVRVFAMTIVGESNKTDKIMVQTGSRPSVFHNFLWKISFICSVAFVGFLLCLYGLKALGKKIFCLNAEQTRNNTSQVNETAQGTLGGHYDEIDSVYYNATNGNNNAGLTLSNILLETPISSNNRNNVVNTATNNDDHRSNNEQGISLSGTAINISETDNASAGLSSDNSYLVPCHNYTNLEIGVTGEYRDSTRVLEYLTDSSSASISENSETQIKSDHQYETLAATNVGVHSYEIPIETY